MIFNTTLLSSKVFVEDGCTLLERFQEHDEIKGILADIHLADKLNAESNDVTEIVDYIHRVTANYYLQKAIAFIPYHPDRSKIGYDIPINMLKFRLRGVQVDLLMAGYYMLLDHYELLNLVKVNSFFLKLFQENLLAIDFCEEILEEFVINKNNKDKIIKIME